MATSALALIPTTPVARDRELHLIRSAIRGDDDKRAILVLGESGLGKSSLLLWAREECIGAGLIPLVVRIPLACSFTPLELARRLLANLFVQAEHRDLPIAKPARQLQDELITKSETDSLALVDMIDAFDAALGQMSLAVIVDDLQWLSPEAARFVLALLRATRGPVRFFASWRDDPDSVSELGIFASSGDLPVDRITLSPLEVDAVALLAERVLGNPMLPSVAHTLCERTLGNPLYVLETLRAWALGGSLRRIGNYLALADADRTGAIVPLEELILRRLHSVSDNEREILAFIALMSREISFQELRVISRQPAPKLEANLRTLVERGLLTSYSEPHPRFGVAHPMYSTVLAGTMDTIERGRAHQRIYEGLNHLHRNEVPSSDIELAHHAALSLERPPELAELVGRAARTASVSGDHREAARWYCEMSQHATSPQDLTRAQILEAEAISNFDPARAVTLLSNVLKSEPAMNRAQLLLGRAKARRRVGDLLGAHEDLNLALQAPESLEFEIRHALAVNLALRHRRGEAEREFQNLARATQETPNYYKALGHLAHVKYCGGHLLEGTHLCEEALGRCIDVDYRAFLAGNLTWYLVLCGEWRRAGALLRERIDVAEATYDVWNLTGLLNNAAKLASLRGQIEIGVDLAARSLSLSRELRNRAAVFDSLGALAWVFLEGGIFDQTPTLEEELELLVEQRLEPREESATLAAFAESFIRLGQSTKARRYALDARRFLRSAEIWGESVDRLDAQILLADGNPSGALGVLGKWLDEPGPVIWEHARLLEVAAQALLKVGKRQDAIARVDEAVDIYQRLGAATRLARAKSWRDANYRRKPGRPRSTLPGGITERERDVLELVVLGKTNREIADALVLSVLTVNKHVENIIMKAGVARRTELVAFAERLGMREPAQV